MTYSAQYTADSNAAPVIKTETTTTFSFLAQDLMPWCYSSCCSCWSESALPGTHCIWPLLHIQQSLLAARGWLFCLQFLIHSTLTLVNGTVNPAGTFVY